MYKDKNITTSNMSSIYDNHIKTYRCMSSTKVLFIGTVKSGDKGKKRIIQMLVLSWMFKSCLLTWNVLGLLALKSGIMASPTKLSVMPPNTMHMRGSTTPLSMAITVPTKIITLSKRSENLNCIHVGVKSRDRTAETISWEVSDTFLSMIILS